MVAQKNDETEKDSFLGGDFAGAMAQIAEEKGIEKEKVIETVAAAIAAAYKKEYGKRGQNIRAEFDPVSGKVKFLLVKEVVDESVRDFSEPNTESNSETASAKEKSSTIKAKKNKSSGEKIMEDKEKLLRFNPERDLAIADAKKVKKGAKVGDVIEEKLPDHSDFGRVAAQTAKQVIIQRIREAERDAMYLEYKEKEGEVISGVVQRIEGRTVFIDLGKSVGVLFPGEQPEGEHYRIGQRLKVYVVKVESDPKGPGITLSRTSPVMVRKLFELEVPEIFAGTVEIKAIAREAGSRSKIAVTSDEEGIDPIGSCVGQKGTRVQAVIDELGGEKVDIIEWSDNTEQFITAALSPAKVVSVRLNEKTKGAAAMVPEDQLSLAIGKRGQNVRLAVKLTEWKIDIVSANTMAQDERKEDGGKKEDEKKRGERGKDDKDDKIKNGKEEQFSTKTTEHKKEEEKKPSDGETMKDKKKSIKKKTKKSSNS